MQRCDYVVFLPSDMEIVTLERDSDFMATILPKLKEFYMDCMLPELTDSRIRRGLPIREPRRILDAAQSESQKKKFKQDVHDKMSAP